MGALMESLGMIAIFVFGPIWAVAEELIFRRIKERHPLVWEKLGRPQMRGLPITRTQRKLNKFMSDPEALESLGDRAIVVLDSVVTISRLVTLLGVLALLGARLKV
ncbi:hypothetical protein EG19_09410 [Thermoanaerobaculum aquaticum]|uniref:Uncharacterized protein n=1 Tax=Thermoanaerobaculum aquaticum TaxID=1312852 RepID=A0A062XWJ4_9BACT|nr:hypothetical protein EG19_09410 [Thermoanaerobaculum aquaticum]BCW93557.1 MAG: hypothetical protein KatS3mg007_1451 [Thermoanaerobaculum sp.]